MYEMTFKNHVTYVTLGNGKAYRLDDFNEMYRRSRHIDEVRQRYTRRGSWYRTHVESRDVPDSKASRADLGDNGRMVSYMVDALDGKFKPSGEKPIIIPTDWGVQLGDTWYFKCVVAKVNSQRIAHKMMMLHWHRVARFVAAVWQNGHEDREKTMQDFGIPERTYQWRLEKYASILHFPKRC